MQTAVFGANTPIGVDANRARGGSPPPPWVQKRPKLGKRLGSHGRHVCAFVRPKKPVGLVTLREY